MNMSNDSVIQEFQIGDSVEVVAGTKTGVRGGIIGKENTEFTEAAKFYILADTKEIGVLMSKRENIALISQGGRLEEVTRYLESQKPKTVRAKIPEVKTPLEQKEDYDRITKFRSIGVADDLDVELNHNSRKPEKESETIMTQKEIALYQEKLSDLQNSQLIFVALTKLLGGDQVSQLVKQELEYRIENK